MSSASDQAIQAVLEREGGLVNDPDDSGGLTKYGISQRTHPDLDISNLTKDQAAQIYKADYWDKLNLDQIHDVKLSAAIFDTAVNMGISAAAKLAQTLVGVDVDGKIGPYSLAAINAIPGHYLLPLYLLERIDAYIEICYHDPGQKKFLPGWISRVLSLR